MSSICSYCGSDLPPTHSGPCPFCGVPGTNHSLEIHDAVHAVDSVEVRLETFEEPIQRADEDIRTPVTPVIVESPYLLREVEFHKLTAKYAISMFAATFFGLSAALGIDLLSKHILNAKIETYEWIGFFVAVLLLIITSIPSINYYSETKKPVINKIKNHFRKQEESIDEQKKQYGKSS